MTDLHIRWPDGEARFSPADSPIAIGRASAAAIPLTEGSVSRQHLSMEWTGSQWAVSDNSTHGTFDTLGARMARQWILTSDLSIKLGGTEGVQLDITSVAAGAPSPRRPDTDDRGGTDPRAGRGNATPAAGRQPSELFPERSPGGPGSGPGAGGSLFADADKISKDVTEGMAGNGGRSAAPRRDRPVPAAPPAPGAPIVGGQRTGGPPPPPSGPVGGPVVSPDQPSEPAAPPEPAGAGSRAAGLLDDAGPVPPADPTPRIRLETTPRTGPEPAFDAVPQSAAAPGISARPAPGSTPDDDSGRFGPDGPTFGPPAGAPRNVGPNTTIISDSTLRLNVGGQDYSFLPGAEVTVGRDPTCLVQLDEQHSLVSRRHLRMTFNDGHWWLEDFSSKGTFVNHRKLKGPYKAEGAFIANLGDDDAGTSMRIITAGEHRVPTNRTMLILGGLAVVGLIALAALALTLTGGDSETVEADRESAKMSTVVLFGLDGGQGSGFFVSDDLIVTNQHVAVLSPQMLVGVSREVDAPAEIEYATELVANHPFLDISVLRISNRATITDAGPDISSDPVGDIGLPAVTIGDSNDITIGDAVFSTGFPGRLTITSTDERGALRLPSVVATSGEAANFTIWPGCSNPESPSFIPADSPPGVSCSREGDIERGVLISTFSSGQGASGSAVFRNNEVVAVVYAGAANEDNASLNITTAAFRDWLDEIVDAN